MTRHAHIAGMGGYQPGEPITNDEIERLVGPLTDDLRQGISIVQRFWQIDPQTGEHRENNADMSFKDTGHNIRMTEVFTVNIVSHAIAEAMHVCGTKYPRGVDELKRAKVSNYGNNIRALESVYVRAMALADGLIFAGNPAQYAEDNKAFDALVGPAVLADAKDWLTRGAHKLTVLPYAAHSVTPDGADRSKLPELAASRTKGSRLGAGKIDRVITRVDRASIHAGRPRLQERHRSRARSGHARQRGGALR